MTKEAQSFLFQAKIPVQTPMVVEGKGLRITIEDPNTKIRKSVIDGNTGAAVGALGWCDDDIAQAIADAGRESVYSFSSSIGNYWAEKLAQFYIENSPVNTFSAALFTSSGSESNENALKIIRQYFLEIGQPKRVKYVGRKQAYHGYTIGALSIADNARRQQFEDILMPKELTPKLSPCYPYRNLKEGETIEQYKDRLIQEVENLFIKEGPETIAAVILETVPGSTLGTVPPVPGYLEGVREVCHKYGALFMLDEVMCGTGRCSKGLNCWESFMPADKGPDIQTIGKTLGSGYVTIAGVLVSPKIRDAYIKGSGFIMGAQTYHSHGFNCRVALAVQEKMKRLELTQNVFRNGNYMGSELQRELKNSSIVGDIRGIGGFWSVEFVEDKTTKKPFDQKLDIGHKIADLIFENGLTVMGMQGTVDGYTIGDHIVLAPAFIITEKDVDEIVGIVVKSVGELEKKLKAEGLL